MLYDSDVLWAFLPITSILTYISLVTCAIPYNDHKHEHTA